MADAAHPPAGRSTPERPARLHGWLNRLVASPGFQRFCTRVPGLSHLARHEGAALFGVMQGFVESQALMALVELGALERLARAPATAPALARALNIPAERLQVLLQAGAAMQLLKRRRDGRFALSPRGAAFLSMPALPALVRHHRVLYADLADPTAFFRGETQPELAQFWPYVFGPGAQIDPGATARYSELMAESQALVTQDALASLSFKGVQSLLDVGGGTGVFLRALHARAPQLQLALFDLPQVVDQSTLPQAIARHGGSFRTDALPKGADMITLIRVLFDHADSTVLTLLQRCHHALPPGGRLAIVEPMSGGASPDPHTDVYFSIYTLAMQTGRTRSADEIAALLSQCDFAEIKAKKGKRPFVTSVIEAQKPHSPS